MKRSRSRWSIAAVAAIGLAVLAPSTAPASSLYTGPGQRPGPDILYRAPRTTAPQLENAGPWNAKPILVSGASAYRGGEFLYQDYLYDDHGANSGPPEPNDPRTSNETVSSPNGRYTYPTDPRYANNAADLIEFRVKPLAKATALRMTLNTMLDPSLTGESIAIGSSATPQPFPHGANASAPAQLFLTAHGTHAEVVRASGAPVTPAPKVSIDKRRRQIQILIPHSAWNPGGKKVRLAAGIGLWNQATDAYLLPGPTRSATTPGGQGDLPNPPAFFNVAFRYHEPLPKVTDIQEDTSSTAWWRDKDQGTSLASGDVSPFHAIVNFARLRAGATNNRSVPTRGSIDRILVSHYERGQGIDWTTTCGNAAGSGDGNCPGEYLGRLQPYNVYVPHKPMPRRGYGMTLLIHSLGANYNQYAGSRNQQQFGERGPGSLVITSESRGPDGFYQTLPEAEVFEIWADAARRYRLDPDFTVVTGYSMGGIGTFKLAAQFPDLFAKAQPTVGFERATARLASLRNIPILMWNGASDELVNPAFYLPDVNALDQLAYRYESDIFVPGEHLSLAINDQFKPAADFLGSSRVNRNPFHITYVHDPAVDSAKYGIVSDHAYWISNIRRRGIGTLDAISRGFGKADPQPSGTQQGGGTLDGGSFLASYPFTRRFRTWGPTPRVKPRNRIELKTSGISALTIDVRRAHVDCNVKLAATTDGPLAVRLRGCGLALRVG
ncbi:MAG: hypothetical protein QOJ38_418 [Solirubrobacterales bacterium]|jgi:hypothetical protein|nr:hypothetical protein [Solirubrobacterales bacterium]